MMIKLTEMARDGSQTTVLIAVAEIASIHFYNSNAEVGGARLAQSRVMMKDGRRIFIAEPPSKIEQLLAVTSLSADLGVPR